MCSFGVKYVTLGKWTGGIYYHIVRLSGPLSTLSFISDVFFPSVIIHTFTTTAPIPRRNLYAYAYENVG